MDALRLGVRRLLDARLRTVLTLGSIAVGAALVVSVLGLQGSLTGSAQRLAGLSGDAALEVTSLADTGVSEDLADTLEEGDAVDAAVPMIRSTVAVEGERTMLLGLDGRAAELGGRVARVLEEVLADVPDGESVLEGIFVGQGLADELGVAAGDSVEVVAPDGEVSTVRVSTVMSGRGSLGVSEDRFVAAALPVAQGLAGKPGAVDSVALVPASGTSRDVLRAEAEEVVGPRVTLQDPDVLVSHASAATESVQQVTFVIAGLALFVATFVVFNTMTVVARLRRQELATLRAIGAPRRAIARDLLVEAGLLGLVGAVVGVPVGVRIADRIVDSLPPAVVASVGVDIDLVLPPYALPLGFGLAVGMSVLAAAPAAWRSTRVPPVESMRTPGMVEAAGEGERVARRPLVAGLVLLAFWLVLMFTAPATLLTVVPAALVLGVVLVTYGLMAPMTSAAAWVVTHLGASGRLAALSVARAPRRVWATATVIAVALSTAIAVGGITANTSESVRANFGALSETDLFVQTTRNDDFPTDVRIPEPKVTAVRDVPGVGEVREGQFAFVDLGSERILVQAIGHPESQAAMFSLARPEAQEAVLEGSGAVISSAYSQRRDLDRDDVLELATPDGAKALPVVDVVDSFMWPQGVLMIGLDQMESWFGRQGASWLELDLDGSRPLAEVRAEVEAVTATPFPLVVMSGEEGVEQSLEAIGQVSSIFLAMQWIIVASAGLAILNTFAVSVIDRRREIGVLRAMGSPRRQVRAVVLLEVGGVTLLGCGIGTAIGLTLHYVSADISARVTGFPIDYAFAPATALVALVATACAAVVGSLWPAWYAARTNVVGAIGYE